MKVFTGYFARVGAYQTLGLVPVGIAQGTPGFYQGLEYKRLAPPWDLVRGYKNGTITQSEYTLRYRTTVLEPLGREQVLKDLETLGRGHDVVLMCWEGSLGFCHRHLVAEWLGGESTEVR